MPEQEEKILFTFSRKKNILRSNLRLSNLRNFLGCTCPRTANICILYLLFYHSSYFPTPVSADAQLLFSCMVVMCTVTVVTLFSCMVAWLFRAVGAGLAGPAATGPIFGLQKCRMNFDGLFNCCSKSSYARRDTISVRARGKHTLFPKESLCQSVTVGKLRSQQVTHEYACHYSGENNNEPVQ